jgi:hypothetical protein
LQIATEPIKEAQRFAASTDAKLKDISDRPL